jgi:hypothetical protein
VSVCCSSSQLLKRAKEKAAHFQITPPSNFQIKSAHLHIHNPHIK